MEQELDKNNGRDMTPQLIKDLGMRYPTEKSTYKKRYGLYECQYCGKEWETIVRLNNLEHNFTPALSEEEILALGGHRCRILNKIY